MPNHREFMVYVVEDDDSVRRALVRLLQACGHVVDGFASADAFLRSTAIAEHACVISDVRMQVMGRLAFQRQLRELHPRMGVIFISADESEHHVAEAKQAGAIAYLRKPVDDQALLDAVESARSAGEGPQPT